MNIHKYHIQHNNYYSNIGNNCTNALYRHTLDIGCLTVCHTSNIWFALQICASLCVLLCVLSFRLDILCFCGTWCTMIKVILQLFSKFLLSVWLLQLC